MARKLTDYALYRGDVFVTIGTIEEISEYLGVKIKTARFYASECYRRRNKNGMILFKIEVDNE